MFEGTNVALATLFKEGFLDLESLERFIEWQIASGIEGILVNGTTGEGQLLTAEERGKVITTSREVIKKRVPLMVGCSAISTSEAICMVKQAEKLGADGVLVIVPYYIKPMQEGIIAHFSDVHDNTNIPIIVYNNPGRCVSSINVDTLVYLVNTKKRIIALKDSDTNLSRISRIKNKLPNFTLLSGDDASLLGYLACGGDGAISVIANIAPKMVTQMVHDKDITLNISLTQLSEAMFVETSPIPLKYALSRKGMCNNELRKPLTVANEKTRDFIDSVMNKWNFC